MGVLLLLTIAYAVAGMQRLDARTLRSFAVPHSCVCFLAAIATGCTAWFFGQFMYCPQLGVQALLASVTIVVVWGVATGPLFWRSTCNEFIESISAGRQPWPSRGKVAAQQDARGDVLHLTVRRA